MDDVNRKIFTGWINPVQARKANSLLPVGVRARKWPFHVVTCTKASQRQHRVSTSLIADTSMLQGRMLRGVIKVFLQK